MMASHHFPRVVAVLSATVLAAAVVCAADAPPATRPARLSFNRDIRSILSDNCFACHGPDSGNRQAGLRLDVAEQAVAELESGSRAIVPEDAASSELVARVVSDDPDSVMPPPDAKIGRLSDEQVEQVCRDCARKDAETFRDSQIAVGCLFVMFVLLPLLGVGCVVGMNG